MPTINTGKFAQADTAGMEAESTKTTIWRHDTKAGAGDIGYTVTAQTEKEEIPRFRLTTETGGAIVPNWARPIRLRWKRAAAIFRPKVTRIF